MDKKYGEFVGVDNLNYAKVIEDSELNYQAETPIELAPVAEIAGEPETNSETTYYNNKPAATYNSEGPTIIECIVSGVPARRAAELTGKNYDPVTGRVYDSGEPNPPDYALSYSFNKGKDDTVYFQYLKGTFSLGAEEAVTKKDNIEIKTYTLTYTAVTTTKKWMVEGKMKSLKRVVGDTTEPSFDPTGWFEVVQTPDTATQPAAFEVSISDPTDNEPAFAVDESLVITFSNKLASHSVTLFDELFIVIPGVVTLDATGKILTIDPSVNLDASTSYALVITKATDVYGQTIENEVINFTTAT